ncbi:MAG TPA: glycosyl hydrolase [Trebonia sp.]
MPKWAVSSGVALAVLAGAIAVAPASAYGAQTATSLAQAAAPASYKGVAIVAGPDVNADLAASGASWYYDWGATPSSIKTPRGVAFVPMIKTGSNVNTATLNEVKREGKYLLGFNEPDEKNEANMSVATALRLWPRLEATGMELGSPAVSYGTNSTTSWIGQFMRGAKSRHYRVNFITVHWYGQHNWTNPTANVNELKTYLEQTYRLYHLPIWITEFSLINFQGREPTYATASQEAVFLTAATKMLTGLPYVQRYAWYTLTDKQTAGNTILYTHGPTTATAVEKVFKKAPTRA